MKNFSVAVLIIGLFLTGTLAQAKSQSSKKDKNQEKTQSSKKSKNIDTEKAEKYKKYAESFELKAKEAETAGDKELAALYRKCAQYQNVIADSFTGKVKKTKAKKAYLEFKSTWKKITRHKTAPKSDHSNKKYSPQEKAAAYQKYAEECKKLAAKAQSSGDATKATYYGSLSASALKIAEAYKNNDTKAIKAAFEEYTKIKGSYKASTTSKASKTSK